MLKVRIQQTFYDDFLPDETFVLQKLVEQKKGDKMSDSRVNRLSKQAGVHPTVLFIGGQHHQLVTQTVVSLTIHSISISE